MVLRAVRSAAVALGWLTPKYNSELIVAVVSRELAEVPFGVQK